MFARKIWLLGWPRMVLGRRLSGPRSTGVAGAKWGLGCIRISGPLRLVKNLVTLSGLASGSNQWVRRRFSNRSAGLFGKLRPQDNMANVPRSISSPAVSFRLFEGFA